MKTPQRRQWRRSGVFIVNFEYISNYFLVFLLLPLNKYMLAGLGVIFEGRQSNIFSKEIQIFANKTKSILILSIST